MPFYKGKKISNNEWIKLTQAPGVGWKDAFGYNDGSEGPPPESTPEEPTTTAKKRRSTKRADQAKAAAAALTGLDITLPGDEDESEED